MLVIDKPAGLVTHPSPGHSSGTLVNALLARGGAEAYGSDRRRRSAGHRPPPRPRHERLDPRRAQRPCPAALMAQLKARRVKKTYLALVHGAAAAEVGRIEAPIGRDPRQFSRMAVVAGGRLGDRLPRPRAAAAAGRCSRSTSSPAGRTRSASTWRRSAIRSPATRSTRPARRGADRRV